MKPSGEIRSMQYINIRLYLYWGLLSLNDQLWMFSAGMAFGSLGGNLQLAASANFAASAAILIFGPAIGQWIDKSSRLKTALLTLLCTKVSVIITMGLLSTMLHFHSSISGYKGLVLAFSIVCIVTNMISVLGTIMCEVIMLRDWVVVICHPDENRLTTTNTYLLGIKLLAGFVPSYAIGELMVWTSIGTGCFAVAVFTLFAFSLEAMLLYSVYCAVPALSKKSVETAASLLWFSLPTLYTFSSTGVKAFSEQPLRNKDGENFLVQSYDNQEIVDDDIHIGQQLTSERFNDNKENSKSVAGMSECCKAPANYFMNIFESWKIYSHQTVLLAGISHSLLYMNILGFDSITDVYAYSQGLTASSVALVKGCGGITGILGSFAYPKITRWLGLTKMGMVAIWADVICLVLPLLSIWLPGSPFGPAGFHQDGEADSSPWNITGIDANWTTDASVVDKSESYKSSIIVFLVGIILSRIGLWLADLAINQIFQESVPESERGTVGSVQNALNYFMDMIKNVAVIFLPNPNTFGYLIIGSWLSVFIGCVCYTVFAKRNAKTGIMDTQRAWSLPTGTQKSHSEIDQRLTRDGSRL